MYPGKSPTLIPSVTQSFVLARAGDDCMLDAPGAAVWDMNIRLADLLLGLTCKVIDNKTTNVMMMVLRNIYIDINLMFRFRRRHYQRLRRPLPLFYRQEQHMSWLLIRPVISSRLYRTYSLKVTKCSQHSLLPYLSLNLHLLNPTIPVYYQYLQTTQMAPLLVFLDLTPLCRRLKSAVI